MKILVADDDPASRKFLESLLAKCGYEVISVDNGLDAWKILSSGNSPRIAILDWLMPGFDGTELCRKIRTLKETIPVYVIMLTIKGEKTDVIQGLESGANDYLSKPYDAGELYARINVGRKIIDLQTEGADRILNLEMNEKKIQTLLAEKELLLYEVHHRIKNNMNMVINLLTLQADSLADATSITLLRNAVGRIKTMGILYDRLYRSENLSKMSAKKYLCELIEEIMNIFPDRYKIDLDIEIEDFILDVQQLSCLGMIVNELVFNAMKYAFRGKESGLITITAHTTGSQAIVMVEDDGGGLPESVSLDNTEGFGLKLVKGLASQMGGTVRVETSKGSRFILDFPVK